MATTDILIGGGRVFFNDGADSDSGGTGSGFLPLGNTPSISVAKSITEIEHYSFNTTTKARQKDLNIVTDVAMSLNFTIDELTADAWGLMLFSSAKTSNVQAGASVVDEVATAPVILDRSIFTAQSNISSLVVDDTAASASPYTVDVDYELINAETGEIKILSTGAITSGLTPLYLTYTSAAKTRSKLVPAADTSIKGSARFEFTAQNGSNVTWTIENCELKPDGDSPLSSTEASEVAFVLNILTDKNTTPAEPFGAVLVG